MTSETIIAIAIAMIGSGGLWGFVQHLIDTKIKKKEDIIKEINCKLDKMVTIDDLNKLAEDLEQLKNDVSATKDLSLSSARNTLNQLSNKYMALGYIPDDEYVAYKAIGESYLAAGGNTEIKAKFEYVMEELKVKYEED